MKTFREYLEEKNHELYLKWRQTGMLEGLNRYVGTGLAVLFENLSKFMTSDNIRSENKCFVYPICRRVYTQRKDAIKDYQAFIRKVDAVLSQPKGILIAKAIEFYEKDTNKKYDLQTLRQKEFDRTGIEPSPDWVGIDYEAEVCAALSQEIIETGI